MCANSSKLMEGKSEWGREGGEISYDFDWLLLMIYLRTDVWITSSVIFYMNTERRLSIY